jgi:hypothetical protein
MSGKLCACGCGEKIVIRPHHKYVGIPNFVKGHSSRVMSEQERQRRSSSAKMRTERGDNNNFIGIWKGKRRSDEQRRKQSEIMKGRYLGEKHPEHSLRMIERSKDENYGFKNKDHRISAQEKRKPGFNSGLNSGKFIHGCSRTRPYNAERQRRRVAMIKNQTPHSIDHNKIIRFYLIARILSILSGRQYDVDHIVPISKGGLHHKDNMRVITHIENMRNGNRTVCKEAA